LIAVAGRRPVIGTRLLAGPVAGRETFAEHMRRLGARRPGGRWLIEVLKQSGLRGRGGAWFPTWKKWTAVADHSDGQAVVVVNGSEGEPLSTKDKTLLERRPHLVLDGAVFAAESLGADEIVVYLSRDSRNAAHALRDALQERTDHLPIGVEETSHRYVAGESSAAISRVSGRDSKPRWSLQHSAEKGVRDQPTLVQNAETLAHVAMIGRYGGEWFRRLGTATSPGTTLMTLTGNVRHPGVYEVDLGGSVGDVLYGVGGTLSPAPGALLGGYFGSWHAAESFERVRLDATPLGCGVLAVLPHGACPIAETTRILTYLAAESAGQCGPCLHGLAALAEVMQRIATSSCAGDDIERVRRWIDMVKGRGACHHPDGAVGQLLSALEVFDNHLAGHLRGIACPGIKVGGFPPPPAPQDGWK
jgi:NADH:ubiquinone oxidoreductase subunit F (NADH-binding)